MESNEPTTKDDSQTLTKAIIEAQNEWAQQVTSRLAMGEEEYGKFAFLDNDTLEMALEELVDLANYAFMTFIKVRLLQGYLAKQGDDVSLEAKLNIGAEAFQVSVQDENL